MSMIKCGWAGVAAIAAVVLGYYTVGETSAPSSVAAAPAAMAQTVNFGDGGQAGCAAVIHASPFARDKANCIADAAPALVAENGDARELHAKVNQLPSCQGPQQINNLTPACVKLNAGAASLVRQLEALVEQGDAEARMALSDVVRRQLGTRTASGEYLDEIERAEAVLLRIAASGGVESEKRIARPGSAAAGPRFAN
ncbi:hypothetical protein ACFDR9_000468 [Janthinobacterium sp. CG_23.3]|uniref:hypothetical protein n=1 Tax=Janthinobacterium sp. CG_23.3 TaxID=3349634 RepID=UPI0038D37EA2